MMSWQNFNPNDDLDWLRFDNQIYSHTKADPDHSRVRYADVLQRWISGDALNESEERITASIILNHPEYALTCPYPEMVILLFNRTLKLDRSNPQNYSQYCLCQYIHFYFQLLSEKFKDAFNTFQGLCSSVGFEYSQSRSYLQGRSGSNLKDQFQPADGFNGIELPLKIQSSFYLIANKILDLNQWDKFQEEYRIPAFPCLYAPVVQYQEYRLRSEALDFFSCNEYDKALDIYRKLRLVSFEIPGTLIHMARVEMAQGEIKEATIHVIKAWQERHLAKPYVIPRIFFLFVLFNLIESKPFYHLLGCIKEALKRTGSREQWDMDKIIKQYSEGIGNENSLFLECLLNEISGYKPCKDIDDFSFWKSVSPVPEALWNNIIPGIQK